jgi:NADH-quinone oxidoreductase subunit A
MGTSSSVMIVAYLALFSVVGFLFIFVHLLIGKFVRPSDPHPEKREIYECGEPTIGSSFVQFDLRFYVVALLFIIFDVEVAFFFPWAVVFGKAANLADADLPLAVVENGEVVLSPEAKGLYRELGVRDPKPAALSAAAGDAAAQAAALSAQAKNESRTLLWLSLADIGVFFAVLLVGFAYVWRRGDLDWVRAMSRDRAAGAARTRGGDAPLLEPALLA